MNMGWGETVHSEGKKKLEICHLSIHRWMTVWGTFCFQKEKSVSFEQVLKGTTEFSQPQSYRHLEI